MAGLIALLTEPPQLSVTLRTSERPEPVGIFRIINVEFCICIVASNAPTRTEVDDDAQVKPVPCTVTEPAGDRTRGETEVMVKVCPEQFTSK